MREKWKIQEVHDDEQQEKKKQTTQQTEGSQETKLRVDKNSKREEQLVKPQQRDHSKRLQWHKSFNSSNVIHRNL